MIDEESSLRTGDKVFHNADIARPEINDKLAFEAPSTKKHPVGTHIGYPKMVHHLSGESNLQSNIGTRVCNNSRSDDSSSEVWSDYPSLSSNKNNQNGLQCSSPLYKRKRSRERNNQEEKDEGSLPHPQYLKRLHKWYFKP